MNIDLDVEPSRPAPDRDEGRDRDVHRSGHRREYDARQPRRSISDRVDGVVRDVGTFRAVALSDVVKRHFDGHTFAAGAALGEAQRQGWIVREKAAGPKGGTYTVIVATPAGAERAAALWARAGRPVWRQVLLPLNVNYSCRFGRLLVRRRTVRWALLRVLKT